MWIYPCGLHSVIHEFCCPCNNVFILYQKCEFVDVVKNLAPQDAYRHVIPFIFYHWYILPGHFLVWTGKQVASRAAAWLHCTDSRGQNRNVRDLSPPENHSLNPAWLSNDTSCNMWDETRYTFQSFTSFTDEVLNGYVISSHFITDVILFQCWDSS